MPKNGKQVKERVMLGVWIDPDLREKGQVAIRILKYGDMTKFIETKLQEAIEQSQKQYAK